MTNIQIIEKEIEVIAADSDTKDITMRQIAEEIGYELFARGLIKFDVTEINGWGGYIMRGTYVHRG